MPNISQLDGCKWCINQIRVELVPKEAWCVCLYLGMTSQMAAHDILSELIYTPLPSPVVRL